MFLSGLGVSWAVGPFGLWRFGVRGRWVFSALGFGFGLGVLWEPRRGLVDLGLDSCKVQASSLVDLRRTSVASLGKTFVVSLVVKLLWKFLTVRSRLSVH